MIAVVVKRLQVRITQGSTGLAARVDHQQLQSQQSGQAGANSAPTTTAARRASSTSVPGSAPRSEEVLGTGTGQGEVMNKGDRGITFPGMDLEKFNELVNHPPAQSPFDPDHLLIDSGSDISLAWNEDMFTCIQPCSLQQCAPVGSTLLAVQGVGTIRFNLGSYVDYHGQRHPLDLEIPSVYYVPQSTMNLLSATHLKRYNIHLNSLCGPNVLVVPSLPSQVSGVWGN